MSGDFLDPVQVGLILVQLLDPATAQQIVGLITGMKVLVFSSDNLKNEGKFPSGKISPIRAPFHSPVSGQIPEKPAKSPFSFLMEKTPYNHPVWQNTADLHLV